jgi:membrane fusion protein, heavy metal efflux system
MKFDLAEAKITKLRPSFEAYGTLRPRSDGEAHVAAPFAGRLAVMRTFPKIGKEVRRGERLALLTPRLGDQGDRASLQQAVQRAKIGLRQATRKHDRLKGLLKGGAIAERQVVDARFDQEQAQSALDTARQRLRQARRVQSTGGQSSEGALEVRAPLAGTVVEVSVVPGAFVKSGAPMFRIVDMAKLWLEVHVAEAHAAELEQVRGVWFTIEGFDDAFEAGQESVVAIGGVVDTHSRTLPLYLGIDNPGGRLKVGMFADVHVVTGEVLDAVTVPVTAIVREAGLPVVYVQRGGEEFERRYVRLGIRDGDRIQINEGVAEGERVVSSGAYAVRLASASGQAPGHGHAH